MKTEQEMTAWMMRQVLRDMDEMILHREWTRIAYEASTLIQLANKMTLDDNSNKLELQDEQRANS